jgi:hypothetical protein
MAEGEDEAAAAEFNGLCARVFFFDAGCEAG